MKGFLYGQTEYNMLNNACKIDEYIEMAKTNHFDFLSITDSNLCGYFKFYNKCLKNNIKPIIGLELKINHNLNEELFLLYPYNTLGLKNLFKIETAKELNELDFSLLVQYCTGIIVILVASKSSITRDLNIVDEAIKKLNFYKNSFEEFYLGISYQNPNLISLNKEIMALGRNLGILSLYIHQLKYLIKEDKKVYDALLAINNKKDEEMGDYTFFIPNEEFIGFNLELFENINNIVEKINYKINKEEVLPKYVPLNTTSSLYLSKLANLGLTKRLKNKNVNIEIYKKRLDYELNIINKMHFADYFLIVWDFIKWAKQNHIFVGPGRGSAASSLVAYALGITEVCPLEYNLLFERFLNPERVSMPDIDTDFPDDRRDEVINYVSQRYGKYHVTSINTFGTFSYKSALRDIARIYKLEEKKVTELSLLLASNDIDYLLEQYKYQTDIYDILYIIKRIDKMPRNTSTHAAGIIIAGCDLRDVIPLTKANNLLQTEVEADDLKELGLLKMDFLGIKNLAIIANVLDEAKIEQRDFRNISLDDKKVYQLLERADTLGLFQLESDGIRRVLKKLKPTKFSDLVAVLALYRPGPMDNIDNFIARRHGKLFEYLHPDLKPILSETYGIIVYQEQIMLIATKFAGYSLGEADVLRRAISNKNLSEIEQLRDGFIKRSNLKGYDKQIATQIFDLIVKFANYGFNKSHSVAYALVSYEMAYLKVHYFGLFMANILNNVIGATSTLCEYIKYAKNHSLIISGPDINLSSTKFVYANNKLYLPLVCIDGVGYQTAINIVNERNKEPYKSYNDFLNRVKLPESIINNLIYAGCFNTFKGNIKQMIEHSNEEANLIDSLLPDLIVDNSDYDFDYLSEKEKQVLGFNLSYDLTIFIKDMRIKKNTLALNSVKLNLNQTAVVKFNNLKVQKTKKNEILKGEIYDDTNSLDFVIFNNLYEEVKSLINLKDIYLVGFKYKTDGVYDPTAVISFVLKLS